MTFFGNGICCGTCKHFESDFRGDTGCSKQGTGVTPYKHKVCREWESSDNTYIVPDCLKKV